MVVKGDIRTRALLEPPVGLSIQGALSGLESLKLWKLRLQISDSAPRFPSELHGLFQPLFSKHLDLIAHHPTLVLPRPFQLLREFLLPLEIGITSRFKLLELGTDLSRDRLLFPTRRPDCRRNRNIRELTGCPGLEL